MRRLKLHVNKEVQIAGRMQEDDAFEHCVPLISETRNHNGELVMLWHIEEFVPRTGNYHPRLYRRLLAELGGCQVSEEDRHS